MPSKNQGRTGREYMGHHEGEMLNTLPKYNYSNGAGWKKHKRCRLDFSIRRKIGKRTYQRLGAV